jgi:predicted AAA+ superfamily ATPase
MYVARALATTFATARRQFPVLVVTGPRQSGRSTMLRHDAPEANWSTLDDPFERSLARQDPVGYLRRFADAVVIDEIQQTPELLPLIKMAVDADRRPGQFLLSGSQQFQWMANIGESLAGRAAILDLLPFSLMDACRPRCLKRSD